MISPIFSEYFTTETFDTFIATESSDKIKIIINGVQLPSSIFTNIPIIDLCNWMCMQDQFLYVVLHYSM